MRLRITPLLYEGMLEWTESTCGFLTLPPTTSSWKEGLKQGRTFATNGPLIEFTLGGQRVGDELRFDGAQAAVPFTAKLRSIVPVDHLEVVCNGASGSNVEARGYA